MKTLALVVAASTTMLAAPALAADLRMPVKAPVVAPAPYFNWSGCYVGVHGGGAWGDKRAFIAPPSGAPIFAFDTSGGLAGGQAGCDFQTGAFVFGLEGSASWASISGSGNDLFTGGISRLNAEAEWIATATARIGWAFGQTLLYAKGGGAWVHDHYRLFDLNGGARPREGDRTDRQCVRGTVPRGARHQGLSCDLRYPLAAEAADGLCRVARAPTNPWSRRIATGQAILTASSPRSRPAGDWRTPLCCHARAGGHPVSTSAPVSVPHFRAPAHVRENFARSAVTGSCFYGDDALRKRQ